MLNASYILYVVKTTNWKHTYLLFEWVFSCNVFSSATHNSRFQFRILLFYLKRILFRLWLTLSVNTQTCFTFIAHKFLLSINCNSSWLSAYLLAVFILCIIFDVQILINWNIHWWGRKSKRERKSEKERRKYKIGSNIIYHVIYTRFFHIFQKLLLWLDKFIFSLFHTHIHIL